jgi:hypothetical protein
VASDDGVAALTTIGEGSVDMSMIPWDPDIIYQDSFKERQMN